MARMRLEAGTVVGGRYRLEERIAAGGMGTVWRARHVELDSEVALKLMSAELSSTPSGEKRFRREAQAAARLQSPHIVRVFDYGVFEGQPYLAMELLRGEDLAARLARTGPLPPERTVEVIDAVAKALDVAHEAGIVHRDLKPANVFLQRVGDDEVVKVLDFGIAKRLGSAQGNGTTGAAMVGSPAYMSPEQVWGEEVGVETDTWAMGVLAHELLSGENPFDHEVLAKIFDRIVKGRPPSPREKRPALPVSVDAFFARALDPKPAQRFHSAKALAEAFREVLQGAQPGTPGRLAPSDIEASETLAGEVGGKAPSSPAKSPLAWLAGVVGVALLAALAFVSLRPQAPLHAPSSAPAPSPSPTPPAVSDPPEPAPPPSAPTAPASASARLPPAAQRPPRPSPSALPAVDPKWGVPVGPPR